MPLLPNRRVTLNLEIRKRKNHSAATKRQQRRNLSLIKEQLSAYNEFLRTLGKYLDFLKIFSQFI